jgi:hypothetical protein
MENKTKEITILVGMVAAGFVAGYCTAMYRVKKAVNKALGHAESEGMK